MTEKQTLDLGEADIRNRPAAATPSPINDNDVFVLNPMFRMRNEKDYVTLYGSESLGSYSLHRSVAVMLALCNGQRTVSDIARLTIPFVNTSNGENAYELALNSVRPMLCYFRLTIDEHRGGEKVPSSYGYPSASPLIRHSVLPAFGNIARVEYDPREFLPKDASEMAARADRPLRERVPSQLNWHLTSECSVDCRYCYLGRRSNVKLLSKERMLELIEEAAEIGVFNITPSGGDILLYPHLFEFMESVSRHKFVPSLVSTKTFLSKDAAKRLAASSDVLWHLQFSIDSTVDEIADWLVRRTGYRRRIFESIENALEVGLRVGAKAVITPYNVLTIPKLYRDLKGLGVETIRLATYARSGYHHSDDLFNHHESFDWLKEQMEDLKEEFPEDKDKLSLQNGELTREPQSQEIREAAWKNRSLCTAGRTAMMVCADGKVIPCEQMPETEEYFVGDLSRQSIEEVWNSDKLKALTYGVPRERFEGKACYDCDEREECHLKMGYCIRDVALLRGTIYHPPANCPKVEVPFVRTV
jgi:radical SAM protein with 4Fe4S-binding SPASM domain